MNEPTKRVIDFLKTNEGIYTPSEIQLSVGVNFRGITSVKKVIEKTEPELAARIQPKKPKRMKMVEVPK